MALAAEKCAPCEGAENRLSSKEVLATLEEVNDWQTLEMERKLFKDFEFKDFKSAKSFVDRVSALAEEQGHHPDISFGWGYAEVVLWTHAVEGISRNDFILAAKIDGLLK